MTEWADAYFADQQTVGGGSTLAAHKRQLARQLGHAVEPEVDTDPPVGAEWPWMVWSDVNRGRGVAGLGYPAPLTWSELAAYAGVVGDPLPEWVVDAFWIFEAAYMRAASDGLGRPDIPSQDGTSPAGQTGP